MVAETMTVVRAHGPRDYRVEEMPVPEPGPGELLVEVDACGICASDMKCWLGGPLFWGSDGKSGYWNRRHRRPRVRRPRRRPRRGRGREARRCTWRSGRRRADRPLRRMPLLPQRASTGCARPTRSSASRSPSTAAWPSTTSSPRSRSCTACRSRSPPARPPTSSRWPAPGTPSTGARSQQGDTVVIGGVGNIGLCMLQIAKLAKPGQLIALDTKRLSPRPGPTARRRRRIDVTAEDAVQRVQRSHRGLRLRRLHRGQRQPRRCTPGLQMIRKLGTFVEFSVFNEPATVNWTVIGDTKELNIHGSHLGPYCYPKAIAALADGRVDVKPLLADAYPAHVISTRPWRRPSRAAC